MSRNEEEQQKCHIRSIYPLHYYVWNGDCAELKRYLLVNSYGANKPDLEQKDPRGRTPLMLAVTLSHKQCANILLIHQARVDTKDATGFHALHEAIANKDSAFIESIYQKRNLQKLTDYASSLNKQVRQLCSVPDFYVEMKWHFSGFLSFLSGAFPSDTYKIYKRANKIRVDTTLVELDYSGRFPRWFRGDRSYIFEGSGTGLTFLELDHEEKWIKRHSRHVLSPMHLARASKPSNIQINQRLSNPLSSVYLDVDKTQLSQCRTRLFGLNRVEMVNGYKCKVYSIKETKLYAKDRVEHLDEKDKKRYKSKVWPFDRLAFPLLGVKVDKPAKRLEDSPKPDEGHITNPFNLSMVEYFKDPLEESDNNQPSEDIGILRETTTRKRTFKSRFWLSDEFPLSLHEQVLPIIELLTHLAPIGQLTELFKNNFPERSFPIKIEMSPLNLLGVTISFENIFATERTVKGVRLVQEEGNHDRCQVEVSCFEPPTDGYIHLPTSPI